MASLILFQSKLPPVYGNPRGSPERGSFRCNLRGDSPNSRGGKEPLEILFAKELKRRGIDSPTSMSGSYPSMTEEIDFQEDRYPRKKTRASRSMDLKSERLEDLIPRARLIVTTGATFFLGFWPLILLTMGIFSAMDHYFGPAFVHRAHHAEASGPHRAGPTDV